MNVDVNNGRILTMVNENKKYSAKLTGNPLLLHEMRAAARSWYSNDGDEFLVKNDIQERNIFQYKTLKSVPKRMNEVLRRFSTLGENELELLAQGNIDEVKGICLLAILKSDKLFFEFFSHVVIENYISGKKFIDNSDMKNFFHFLVDQSDDVKKWTDKTIKKMEAVLKRILFDSGYLSDLKKLDIILPFYSMDFKNAVIDDGDKFYFSLMRGELGH